MDYIISFTLSSGFLIIFFCQFVPTIQLLQSALHFNYYTFQLQHFHLIYFSLYNFYLFIWCDMILIPFFVHHDFLQFIWVWLLWRLCLWNLTSGHLRAVCVVCIFPGVWVILSYISWWQCLLIFFVVVRDAVQIIDFIPLVIGFLQHLLFALCNAWLGHSVSSLVRTPVLLFRGHVHCHLDLMEVFGRTFSHCFPNHNQLPSPLNSSKVAPLFSARPWGTNVSMTKPIRFAGTGRLVLTLRSL